MKEVLKYNKSFEGVDPNKVDFIIDNLFQDVDIFIDISESVLIEFGCFNFGNYLIKNKKDIILFYKKNIIKHLIQKEVSEKDWQVYSILDTEILSCSTKAQSLLEAFDVRNERKLNIMLPRILNKELVKEINYGSMIKIFIKNLSGILEIKNTDLISSIAKQVALNWYPKYSKNIDSLNKKIIKNGLSGEVKDEEINMKSNLTRKNNATENNWNFEKKVKKIFDEKEAHCEIEMGVNGGVQNKVETKNLEEMLGHIFLKNVNLNKLYENKRVIDPSNFIERLEVIEESGLYGFENIKTIFNEEILPKDSLSILKMVTDLFESIVDDENLKDENKVLLTRLQFPIIKTSLIDKNQILLNDSIVNKVMDKTTNKLRLMNDFNSYDFKLIKNKINEMVELNYKDYSHDLVMEKWNDFLNTIIVLERKVKLIEVRNKEKEAGLYNFNKASLDIEFDLSSILLDAEFVRKDFCNFIERDIKNNLIITKLKDFKNNKNDYIGQKNIFELWFNNSFIFNNEKKSQEYSQMLYKVLVSNNPLNKKTYYDKIKEINNTLFRNKKIKIIEKEKDEFKSVRFEKYSEIYNGDKKINDENKSIKSGDLIKFNEMKYGDWFEIKIDSIFKTCKLLLKLNNDTKFIFVNSSGVKNFEASLHQLIKLKESGDLIMLEKNTVMERALDKILKK